MDRKPTQEFRSEKPRHRVRQRRPPAQTGEIESYEIDNNIVIYLFTKNFDLEIFQIIRMPIYDYMIYDESYHSERLAHVVQCSSMSGT